MLFKALRVNYFTLFAIAALLALQTCTLSSTKEERTAQKYCGACHLFPEPHLLDKETWRKRVLPQMSFFMGRESFATLMQLSEKERPIVMSILPREPMVTQEEWDNIKKYYATAAPDSLTLNRPAPYPAIEQFEITLQEIPGIPPTTSLLKIDSVNKKIFMGNRNNTLYAFDFNFAKLDSTRLYSPPSEMKIHGDEIELSLMGVMDPNDLSEGEIVTIRNGQVKPIIDSLQRPVHFEKTDLNADGLDDYVICAFGNFTGKFLLYENKGDDKFIRHVLSTSPGARNVDIRDLNNDGLPDITVLMTQGDERIVIFYNEGDMSFEQKVILRFAPVYGSSYFEYADFNHDNRPDILYANGDNADFSQILKPYHGLRIFENEGDDQFTEVWFFPMYGAFRARAFDFDEDGDLDIAAASFFPDRQNAAENSFIYLENTKGTFLPHMTSLAARYRWMTMDIGDIDGDGDSDLLLGAWDFITRPEKSSPVLVLKNKLQ